METKHNAPQTTPKNGVASSCVIETLTDNLSNMIDSIVKLGRYFNYTSNSMKQTSNYIWFFK